MKIFDLLNSPNLKLPYNNSPLGIEVLLKEKFDIFIKELNELYQTTPSENIANTIESLKASTFNIINIIHKYLSGNIPGAYTTFNNVLEKNESSIKHISKYYEKYVFRTYYKARLCIEENRLFTKNG